MNKRCDRVHSINMLEEEDLCRLCHYCKFLDKLKDALYRNLFFTVNGCVELWDIRVKDNKLEAIPVL